MLQHDGSDSSPLHFVGGSLPALPTLHGVSNEKPSDWDSLMPQLESLSWTWVDTYAGLGDWGQRSCLQLRRLPNLRYLAGRWIRGIGDLAPLLQQLPPGLWRTHFVFENTMPWRLDVLGRWVSMAQRLPGMHAVMSSDKPPGCTSNKTYISIELHRKDEQPGE